MVKITDCFSKIPLISNTHKEAHSCMYLQSWGIWCLLLFSEATGCAQYIHDIHSGKTATHVYMCVRVMQNVWIYVVGLRDWVLNPNIISGERIFSQLHVNGMTWCTTVMASARQPSVSLSAARRHHSYTSVSYQSSRLNV